MTPARQSIARPNLVARMLVAVTVRVLPAEHRARYDDELSADLVILSGGGRQVREGFAQLAGAFGLRSALLDRTGDISMNWKCRIWLHTYSVVGDDNPENRRAAHRECERCGAIKEIKDYEPAKYLGRGGTLL